MESHRSGSIYSQNYRQPLSPTLGKTYSRLSPAYSPVRPSSRTNTASEAQQKIMQLQEKLNFVEVSRQADLKAAIEAQERQVRENQDLINENAELQVKYNKVQLENQNLKYQLNSKSSKQTDELIYKIHELQKLKSDMETHMDLLVSENKKLRFDTNVRSDERVRQLEQQVYDLTELNNIANHKTTNLLKEHNRVQNLVKTLVKSNSQLIGRSGRRSSMSKLDSPKKMGRQTSMSKPASPMKKSR